uniref:Uncharacterized protein n=1 Tax=Anguilla anguilla TaxID=7936 RepID=A0A0E9TC80_ANGAN
MYNVTTVAISGLRMCNSDLYHLSM